VITTGGLEPGPLYTFETDRRKLWLVERGVEILSKASRHLPDDLKAPHPETLGAGLPAMCCATTKAPPPRSCGRWCVTICRRSIRSAAMSSPQPRRASASNSRNCSQTSTPPPHHDLTLRDNPTIGGTKSDPFLTTWVRGSLWEGVNLTGGWRDDYAKSAIAVLFANQEHCPRTATGRQAVAYFEAAERPKHDGAPSAAQGWQV
jgi:hypothetical protein